MPSSFHTFLGSSANNRVRDNMMSNEMTYPHQSDRTLILDGHNGPLFHPIDRVGYALGTTSIRAQHIARCLGSLTLPSRFAWSHDSGAVLAKFIVLLVLVVSHVGELIVSQSVRQILGIVTFNEGCVVS